MNKRALSHISWFPHFSIPVNYQRWWHWSIVEEKEIPSSFSFNSSQEVDGIECWYHTVCLTVKQNTYFNFVKTLSYPSKITMQTCAWILKYLSQYLCPNVCYTFLVIELMIRESAFHVEMPGFWCLPPLSDFSFLLRRFLAISMRDQDYVPDLGLGLALSASGNCQVKSVDENSLALCLSLSFSNKYEKMSLHNIIKYM